MSLAKRGGRSDGGVDLQGYWWLPTTTTPPNGNCNSPLPNLPTIPSPSGIRRLRILVQCKAESKKIGPKYIRELEGVLSHFHSSKDKPVAVFISESKFTKAAILRTFSSHIPFLLIHLPPLDDSTRANAASDGEIEEDHLGSALWNSSLSSSTGVLQNAFQLRWEYASSAPGIEFGRPALWMDRERVGNCIPPGYDLESEPDQDMATESDDVFSQSLLSQSSSQQTSSQ